MLALALALPTAGRRYHDDRKHRHGHTFLQLCTDGDGVHPQACVEKVENCGTHERARGRAHEK